MGVGNYYALPLNMGFFLPVGAFTLESDFKTKV